MNVILSNFQHSEARRSLYSAKCCITTSWLSTILVSLVCALERISMINLAWIEPIEIDTLVWRYYAFPLTGLEVTYQWACRNLEFMFPKLFFSRSHAIRNLLILRLNQTCNIRESCSVSFSRNPLIYPIFF